ncbi:YkvA family protein [Streptomyces sp. MST-110588]|uniref:YkvA family protein n=1 Tax=Streptomyces sp. MST-110588 TaxID=2833628 RepID=UPI001F5C2906|nr:YkvA family protein [Streptomyces sp. MST-110588]UNO43473.1 DUF1232 domain-containing protein [Streptomyces sp. MST-110588]
MSGELWTVVVVVAVLVAAMAAVAIVLLVKVVRARHILRAAGIPLENKILYWGAILYLISPVDLLPDPVLLDDIGVLLLALRSLYAAADAAGLRRNQDHRPPLAGTPDKQFE